MGFLKNLFGFVSDISSPIASVINTNTQRKMQERAIEQENNAIKNQNAFNQAQYEDWKQYNSPAEQMKRLEAAGVNPNLAAGMVNSGNVSSPFSIQSTGDMDSSQPFGSVVAAGLASLPSYQQKRFARWSLNNQKMIEEDKQRMMTAQADIASENRNMVHFRYQDALFLREVLNSNGDYENYVKNTEGFPMSQYQYDYYKSQLDKQILLNENVAERTYSSSLKDIYQQFENNMQSNSWSTNLVFKLLDFLIKAVK